MRVTITEKGLEFKHKIMFETAAESPRRAFSPLNNSGGSGSRLLRFDRLRSSTALIDALLKSEIANSPPKQIRIKKPLIIVSPQFSGKYGRDVALTPPATSSPLLLRVACATSPDERLKLQTAGENAVRPGWDTERPLRARTTLTLKGPWTGRAQSRAGTSSSPSRAVSLISESLRASKMKARQRDMMQQRAEQQEEMQRLLSYKRESMRKMTDELMEEAMQGEEGVARIRRDVAAQQERYWKRVKGKHQSVLREWGQDKRLRFLSVPFRGLVHTPYLRLKESLPPESARSDPVRKCRRIVVAAAATQKVG